LTQPEATPAKPLQPPATSLAKTATDWLKRTAPLVLPSSTPATPPAPIAEAKPALKPPVLPKRALLKEADSQAIPALPEPPVVVETKDAAKKVDAPLLTSKPPTTTPALPPKLPEKEPATAAPAVEKKPAASSTAPSPEKSAATAPPPLKTDNPPVAAWAAPLVPLAKAVNAIGDAATAATTSSPKETSPISVKVPEQDKSAASTTATGQIKAAPAVAAAIAAATASSGKSVTPTAKAPLPKTRVERARQRRFVATLLFWAVILPATILGLVLGSLYFGRETRVEGQVIPPPGMSLNNEMWIVTDFSSLASGIAEDLAQERTPIMQEVQERQEHVQRAQADVAAREERIRLIQEQISAAKGEIDAIVKKSRNATQQIWSGEGAEIENEYQSHFDQLKKAIADRAKSLNLPYQPDETYQSPEVWANAYRLALYQVPPGVDSAKEHQWLSDQLKQWRDLQKTLDARKAQLRDKAAQVKLEPAPKITDLNSKIEDLQQRVDSTTSEEIPLKAELQQAQASLADAQAADANLDDKYFKQLYSLPGEATTKRIPLKPNGRFTWIDDNNFMEGEKDHHYLIFSRATRSDGRQYWALHRFSIGKDQTVELIFEPGTFLSTKAILRPNLSPEEQEQ
jgi:predicted  nucleic acid-binding Zn-ribbon protein